MLKVLSDINSEINTFPVLRGLMVKHRVSQDQMSQLLDNTPKTFGKKINGESNFIFSDMWEISEFFKKKGEIFTIDNIFFDWIVH